MPWYRIHADHGPGHQSSTEHYVYYVAELRTKADKRAAWDEIFDDGHFDWPIGGVELVEKLPQHIHEDKIASARGSIQRAERMLEILEKTETKPVIAVRYEVEVRPFNMAGAKPIPKRGGGYQARLLTHPTVVGTIKPKREGAVLSLLATLRAHNRKVLKERKGATWRYTRRSEYAVISR